MKGHTEQVAVTSPVRFIVPPITAVVGVTVKRTVEVANPCSGPLFLFISQIGYVSLCLRGFIDYFHVNVARLSPDIFACVALDSERIHTQMLGFK